MSLKKQLEKIDLELLQMTTKDELKAYLIAKNHLRNEQIKELKKRLEVVPNESDAHGNLVESIIDEVFLDA